MEHGVKDGYASLKGLIQRKYTRVNVEQLEANSARNAAVASLKRT